MCKRIFFGLFAAAAICGALLTFGQVFAQQAAPAGVPAYQGPGLEAQPGTNFFYLRAAGPASQQRDAELNAKIAEEVQKYTAAKDDGVRDAAKKQIQSALAELFDIRQTEREAEIKQIEERVAHLRDTLKKRESMRQELIDHHLTTLLQDAEGLGWGTEGGNGYFQRVDTRASGPVTIRAVQTEALPTRP